MITEKGGSKYTAGELAELVGVSPRTIRFYDKKGLLIPTDYSSRGYRLYNEDSILQLQTIKMLQYIGMSLQEIKDYLIKEENTEFKEILWNQKLMLEKKRKRIEQIIYTLDEMLYDRQLGQSEVKRAVDIMQLMNMEETFDYRHNFYEEYSARAQDWFQWIFDRLELFEGIKVLDLGCGRGNIWIRNWSKIPQGTTITLVDKRRSAIEYLESFYRKNQRLLQEGVRFQFLNQDIETDFIFQERYDRIVADHLWTFISKPEKLMKAISNALTPNGFMHSTHNSYGFMEKVQQLFEKAGIAMDLNKRIQQQTKERTQLENHMKNCFTQVDCVVFENRIVGIRQADAILRYVQSQDPQLYTDHCEDWKEYEQKINQELKEGAIFEMTITAPLYRCSVVRDSE